MTRQSFAQRSRPATFAALVLVLFASSLRADGTPETAQPPASAAAPVWMEAWESIDQERLRAWVRFLAAPELRGRRAGEPSYDVAALWVATQLQALGVQPAGDGDTYRQEFELVEGRPSLSAGTITITRGDGTKEEIALEGECTVLAPTGPLEWTGPWVFAGYGQGPDRDAPDDFYGLDLSANPVVLVVPPPGDASSGYRGAALAGAKRVVVVSDELAKQRRRGRGRSRTSLRSELEERDRAEREERGGVDVIYITTEIADRILGPLDTSVARLAASPVRPKPVPLAAVELTLSVPWDGRVLHTSNVAARIEGSDPALAGEWVVIGAHLDHVGVSDDGIFRGADDNASGSAAVLAVARALASLEHRPRRSVLFLWFGAEELGLFGSRYYVDHPLVPLDRTVFMVNLDMVGRDENHDGELASDNVNSLHVVASKRLSLELDPWIEQLNAHIGFDFEYDEERVWDRSDQWSFIAKGVPAIFFFGGFHPDYHRPTDTPEKLNYDKIERVARLVVGLVWEVAERERPPAIQRL